MKHLIALAALLLPTVSQAGELKLTLLGENLDGKRLYVAVQVSPESFPSPGDQALRRSVLATGLSTELSITDIAPGEYAVSVFADLNGNGKLDSNFIGIPTEPTGVSRDAAGRFGPPKFKDAVFEIGAGTTTQTIHIK